MAGSRKKHSNTSTYITVTVLGLSVIASWWLFLRGEGVKESRPKVALAALAAVQADRKDSAPSGTQTSPGGSTPADPSPPKPTEALPPTPNPAAKIQSLVETGKQALVANNPLAARVSFGEALALGPVEAQSAMIRRELVNLGDELVFSPRVYENDRSVARYILQTGDTLAKVAVENKVTADLLALTNSLADKNLIRAGQTIKIIKGPFHAVVDKKSYLLDLYLGDTFVKQLPVGLGADDSTPSGKWKVSSKLANPTYYPPRGGTIIAADDPKNPLGERWIGLTGIEGSAVGQERYGIHGTIEPESIGKNTSMGCIRMRNEDVEFLYRCLIEKHSTVTVR